MSDDEAHALSVRMGFGQAVTGGGHPRKRRGRPPGRWTEGRLSNQPLLALVGSSGHDCDNPLCVNVEHTRPATVAENTAEWARRRKHWAGPLADPRGTRARAWAIRDGLREGRPLAALLEESKSELERGQLALW